MMMQQISVMMGVPTPNVIETIAKSRLLVTSDLIRRRLREYIYTLI
jgi:hypothetical protein